MRKNGGSKATFDITKVLYPRRFFSPLIVPMLVIYSDAILFLNSKSFSGKSKERVPYLIIFEIIYSFPVCSLRPSHLIFVGTISGQVQCAGQYTTSPAKALWLAHHSLKGNIVVIGEFCLFTHLAWLI